MKIVVITFTRDGERMLPFFIDHYKKFCDEIIIYDYMSTDKTCEIANKYMCKKCQYDAGKGSAITYGTRLKNTVWKLYKEFDWVIIVDLDEFIYHKSILNYLENAMNLSKTVLVPTGYSMYSPTFPKYGTPITEQIKKGIYAKMYSKPCIFNPKLVEETNFSPGAHNMHPKGTIVIDNDKELKLLHYRFIYELKDLENIQKIMDSRWIASDTITRTTPEWFVRTISEHKTLSKEII